MSIIDGDKLVNPFYIDEIAPDAEGNTPFIKDKLKFEFGEEYITSPSKTQLYYLYGNVIQDVKGLFHNEPTFKEDLKYYMSDSRKYVFLKIQ